VYDAHLHRQRVQPHVGQHLHGPRQPPLGLGLRIPVLARCTRVPRLVSPPLRPSTLVLALCVPPISTLPVVVVVVVVLGDQVEARLV